MKPREQGGVVDKRLNVYGTTNLKCVDLSICPVSDSISGLSTVNRYSYTNQDNLGTNTYSSALLVGERGADLIAEDLGMSITPRRSVHRTLNGLPAGLKLRLPHAPVPHAPVPSGVPTTQQFHH